MGSTSTIAPGPLKNNSHLTAPSPYVIQLFTPKSGCGAVNWITAGNIFGESPLPVWRGRQMGHRHFQNLVGQLRLCIERSPIAGGIRVSAEPCLGGFVADVVQTRQEWP